MDPIPNTFKRRRHFTRTANGTCVFTAFMWQLNSLEGKELKREIDRRILEAANYFDLQKEQNVGDGVSFSVCGTKTVEGNNRVLDKKRTYVCTIALSFPSDTLLFAARYQKGRSRFTWYQYAAQQNSGGLYSERSAGDDAHEI